MSTGWQCSTKKPPDLQSLVVLGREESRMGVSHTTGTNVCLQSHRVVKEQTAMVSPVVIC